MCCDAECSSYAPCWMDIGACHSVMGMTCTQQRNSPYSTYLNYSLNFICPNNITIISIVYLFRAGSQDGVNGIGTRYGLEGPGIESRWGEIFRTYPDRLRCPPSLLYNGYRVFPGGKGGQGVMLTTHPLLVLRLRKSWAIPSLTLWALLGLLRGSPVYLLTYSIQQSPSWEANLFCS